MRPYHLSMMLLLLGCGTPWVEAENGPWRTLRTQAKSNGAGNFTVKVKPEIGETAMLVTLRPDDSLIDGHVRYAQAGSRVIFRADEEVQSDKALTNAGYIGHTVSFNWPIRDGFLQIAKHEVQFGLVDRALQYTAGTAEVSVVLKKDVDFEAGALKVNVIYAGSTRDDPEVVEAVATASDIWRTIYAQIGIELDIEYFDWDGAGVLQAPGQGDLEAYDEISEQAPFGGVNLVVVEDIAGIGDVYGFAGDIPGPMVASGRSAVAVSVALAAGTDGVFDAVELQILAETMAHETGHYLGLYHPVEGTFEKWDALEDTVDCNSEPSCVDLIGNNLMFPFPICNSNGCVQQEQLTQDQAMVAHRYVGVL